MRFFLSTFVSIGLLFSIILLPIHLFLFSLFGIHGIISLILASIILIELWWHSTYLYDFILVKRYGARWVSIKEFNLAHSSLGLFLQDVYHKAQIQIPRFGIIEDDKPLAVVYGSNNFDARLILSTGFFRHLDEKEQEAAIAHELGHIKSGDYPILATAYLPAFFAFELSLLFLNRKNTGRFQLVYTLLGRGLFAIHYLLSQIVIMQTRIREDYADEFCSRYCNPNTLALAISKISNNYITQADKNHCANLMQLMRPFAILDYKQCRGLGLAYLDQKQNGTWILVENLVLQDIFNPWAAYFQLKSSHPLPGKRLFALCKKAQSLGNTPFLDMDRMFSSQITSTLMRLNFISDFLIYMLARFSPALIAILLLIGFFYDKSQTIGIIVVLYGLGMMLLSLYSFSYIHFRSKTIKSQLDEHISSPIKGKPLLLEGVIREKSSLGLDLPEDLIFADSSGEIFIGSRTLFPLVYSPFIAPSQLFKYKDQKAKVKGWYLRGTYPKLIIDEIETPSGKLKGHQRTFDIGLACVVVAFGLLVFFIPI